MKSYIGGDDEVPTVCDTGTEDYLDKACCFLERMTTGNPAADVLDSVSRLPEV